MADPVSEPVLSEPERRKLFLWRAMVRGSIAIVWIAIAVELALLLWPLAPKGAKIAAGAVLVESFLTCGRGVRFANRRPRERFAPNGTGAWNPSSLREAPSD